MIYAIEFSPTSLKQLEKLERPTRERILAALERSRVNPFQFFFKLTGRDFYRMRVGDYRVIADISKQRVEILVIKIGKRENVYN
ncbi:MAG: type II toxin-antitoxin system RelE/ParE family toxin [Candidatus Diapherotrites archaeon]|nr:type II toxin-antitoxin system RelE/ParE family toxin [Candidatus Diapherotrites archaeon]